MPKNLPVRCKVCGARRADGVPISRRGLCYVCGTARMVAAYRGQAEGVDRVSEAQRAKAAAAGTVDTPRGGGGAADGKPMQRKALDPSGVVDGKPTRPAA